MQCSVRGEAIPRDDVVQWPPDACGGFVAPVLSGKLKIGGKIWRLLPLIALFKTQAPQ